MSDEQLPVPYQVGYGKPPANHRFQKGRSGNPNGRPKRKKAKQAEVDTGFGRKAAEEFLRMEAYRPVTIREGDKVIELPAIQAVFRAMGVAAMKGNRFVQKTLAEMVSKMEADHYATKFELFSTMFDYKHKWDEELQRRRQLGITAPDPVPHPDDIILNPNTGDVQILGPQTKEEKQRLDHALARRAEAQELVSEFASRYRRTRDASRKAFWLEEWHHEQQLFDIINDAVGPRYKAELQNRSWAQGASQEGRALGDLKRGQNSGNMPSGK